MDLCLFFTSPNGGGGWGEREEREGKAKGEDGEERGGQGRAGEERGGKTRQSFDFLGNIALSSAIPGLITFPIQTLLQI